jgi:branched-subunit amino acid aminotransferase/4-amino-4-deoxychorismate lyase
MHKSTSYAVCAIGLHQAVARGADEGAFVTGDGLLLEGTSTNIFALASGRLITAPLAAGILPGVVRGSVLLHARQLGLTCEERPPSNAELMAGSFLTSSLTLLAPVRSLNGVTCAPPGSAFTELGRRYAEALDLR